MEAQPIAKAAIADADSGAGDLKTRAQRAAAIAAAHAPAVDVAARFPAEAFAAIKAQRLLGIMVPVALGGEGARISEVADVCYLLGQSCSSSGMIYAMHQIKVACVSRHMGDSAALQRLLRRLCAEQLLLASSTTEGQGGGNIRSSEAPIEYHDGERISLERRASVISYGAYADGIVTTARRAADAAASDQVLVAFLKSDYTLSRLQGWDALGMRGTCSEGYTLKAAAIGRTDSAGALRDHSQPHHGAVRPSSMGLGVDRHRDQRDRTGAGFHPQRHASQPGADAARRPTVHQGAGDAAHAARDAGDLAPPLRADHGRPPGPRGARLSDDDHADQGRGFGARRRDSHERDARLRPVRLPQ